jgi:hypothetical protein
MSKDKTHKTINTTGEVATKLKPKKPKNEVI